MKHYTCDHCKETIKQSMGNEFHNVEPEVILSGIIGASGGILLPARFHTKHFCNLECFWQWIDRNHPRGE